MGNSENIKHQRYNSIFRFLKDYWPAIIAAGLIAFDARFIPVLAAVIALAVGFLPKIIELVKSIFGFGKRCR